MTHYRTNDDLLWIAVDLDSTTAMNTGHPEYKLLGPVLGAREALQELAGKGWKIIIHTARPWSDYETIENWLLLYDIPFKRIVCGKLLAKYYIDDRNIDFREWSKMKQDIV